MNTYSFNNGYGTIYNFEIVKKIPSGMEVWNIGKNMNNDNLIPFCFTIPGTYNVIPNSLKAVHLPKKYVLILRKASARGFGSISSCKRYITKFENSNSGKENLYNLAVNALKILNIITDSNIKSKTTAKKGGAKR